MGVHSAKTMVIGCLFANILAIAAVKESGKMFITETLRDDVMAPYCQFKRACFLDPSTAQAQFIEPDPTTDDQGQTVAVFDQSGDRPA